MEMHGLTAGARHIFVVSCKTTSCFCSLTKCCSNMLMNCLQNRWCNYLKNSVYLWDFLEIIAAVRVMTPSISCRVMMWRAVPGTGCTTFLSSSLAPSSCLTWCWVSSQGRVALYLSVNSSHFPYANTAHTWKMYVLCLIFCTLFYQNEQSERESMTIILTVNLPKRERE